MDKGIVLCSRYIRMQLNIVVYGQSKKAFLKCHRALRIVACLVVEEQRPAEKSTERRKSSSRVFFWLGFKEHFCPLMPREEKQAACFTSDISRRKQWFGGRNSPFQN